MADDQLFRREGAGVGAVVAVALRKKVTWKPSGLPRRQPSRSRTTIRFCIGMGAEIVRQAQGGPAGSGVTGAKAGGAARAGKASANDRMKARRITSPP
jgi:hypothetical protein